MIIEQKNFDKYDIRNMRRAEEVATWSDDPNKKVGAVITSPDSKTVIAEGYNDIPHDVPNREEILKDKDRKNEIITHAEISAISKANKMGMNLSGCGICVSPLPPCERCARAIIQAGIKRVVFLEADATSTWKETGEKGKRMMRNAGLEVVEIKKQDLPPIKYPQKFLERRLQINELCDVNPQFLGRMEKEKIFTVYWGDE